MTGPLECGGGSLVFFDLARVRFGLLRLGEGDTLVEFLNATSGVEELLLTRVGAVTYAAPL